MATALGLGTPYARADDEDTAEKRFKEGHDLLDEKRYGEACQKFEQSQQAAPASGAQLALAYCQELSGLLATSWRSYLAAEDLARIEGHEERTRAAIERSDALKERVSTLTIVVPSSVAKLPGLRLSLDGKALSTTAFGTAIPLDGGAHYIEASAPERSGWNETVLIEGERHRKTVIVPGLDPLPVARASAPPVTSPLVASPPNDVPGDSGTNTARHVSLALGAASLLTLGTGVFFGVKAYSKNDASNSDGHCNSAGCDPEGTELRNDAISAAQTSTWFFAASSVLALSSVTLYFVSAPSSTKSSARVGARVGADGAQVSLSRAF
jgi:serine/threonine-protein kinase